MLSEGKYATEIKDAIENKDKSNKSIIIRSANVISNNDTGRAIMKDQQSRSIIWKLVQKRAKNMHRGRKESTKIGLADTLNAFLHVNADGSPALSDGNDPSNKYPSGGGFITWKEALTELFKPETNTKFRLNYEKLTFTKN